MYEEHPTCFKCKSTKWTCYDEQAEWFQDTTVEPSSDEEEFFLFPVGYMRCENCGTGYLHCGPMPDGVEHIGSSLDLLRYRGG